MRYNKSSKVLESTITKISRGRDGAIIEVGMETKSGRIRSIERDKRFTGGMKAMTDIGSYIAIPAIVLMNEI